MTENVLSADSKQPHDEDVAAGTISEELSLEDDKRLLRRIDLFLLPVMAVFYMFQFLDKSALGFTAIMGLRDDLRLSGEDFSWAIASYVFWGAALMITAVANNAAGLLTLRFFLGIFESPIAPGLTAIVSMWYKRSEQPLRHAAWFLGNSVAGCVPHLWWSYFCMGVRDRFFLPDVPTTAWFLSQNDRSKVITRVRENMTGIKSNEFKWPQCREALLDVKTWFVVLIQLCANIPNGGVHSFGPIVVQGLGFGEFQTLLLQSGSYLVQFALVLIATGGSTYLRNTRTYFMVWNFALSILGSVLIREYQGEQKWVSYAGFCLVIALGANFPLMMAIISGNFGGFTKKMTVNAICFIAYCAGNIIGPQLFFAREAPSYPSGFLAMMVCFCIGLLSCIALRVYLIMENRRRDSIIDAPETDEVDCSMMANLMDKTDKEIPQFSKEGGQEWIGKTREGADGD
ncbi:hypothetical protein CEP51_008963 [Fusarium floridanum]|uniref:Major facilitator superfamily (MFS) profile domain-containing protein n=1 Tax=Fusarium floridanum TaxID=1325733 RepID=A0A428RJ88_9HYPO|nr:hypothetical protein CEP51_008963 [Fusarium floridanum]